jgi:ubiquitin C-terminal hydrolase
MTDHKYTDDEVIRALECCANGECDECPYQDNSPCKEYLNNAALDLINRQRAEIEILKKDNEYILMQHKFQRRPSGDCWNDVIEKAKSEAVKEFAERLKQNLDISVCGYSSEEVTFDVELTIDNLVKEMTGEKGCPTCKHFIGCETACGGEPCDLFK